MPSSIVDVLLASEEPSVRWKVRVHALGEDPDSRAIRRLQGQVRRAPRTRALLDGWAANPCGSYTKWQGGHWVLAALADLGYPAGDKDLLPLRDQLLRTWLAPRYLRDGVPTTLGEGQSRRPPSRSWPAGTGAAARSRATPCCRRSSWGWTTVAPRSWSSGCCTGSGRTAAGTATRAPDATLVVGVRDAAADARPERVRAGAPGHRPRRPAPAAPPRCCSNAGCCSAGPPAGRSAPDWSRLHYPVYWRYDVLAALKGLAEVGLLDDPRCDGRARPAREQATAGRRLADRGPLLQGLRHRRRGSPSTTSTGAASTSTGRTSGSPPTRSPCWRQPVG